MAQGHGLPGDMIGDMAEDMSKRRRLIHPLRPPEAILSCTPRLRWTGGRRRDQCMARPDQEAGTRRLRCLAPSVLPTW